MSDVDQQSPTNAQMRVTGKPQSLVRDPPRSRGKRASLSANGVSSPASFSITNQSSPAPWSRAPAEKRAKWLAALTREELEQVAAGVKWNPGDPHSAECFVCKQAGGLVGCNNCPRAYHANCAGFPAGDSPSVETWPCPACALLELDEIKGLPSSSNAVTHVGIGRFADNFNTSIGQGMVDPSGRLNANKRPRVTYESAEQEKSKKRSRYSTLPSEIDEALAIINRELEAASYSKSIIAHTEARLHVAEQDLAIERGKAALAASKGSQDDAEIFKATIRRQDDMIKKAAIDYEALKAENEKNAKKVQDLEDWKRRMKIMINATSDD